VNGEAHTVTEVFSVVSIKVCSPAAVAVPFNQQMSLA